MTTKKGDIEQALPTTSPTVDSIFAKYEEKEEGFRTYLGASIIGHSCSRYLWYTFRWCGKEKFDGRMKRLFNRGDIEEIRMVRDLKNIGCEVHEKDPETGEQFAVTFANGHGGGHMDGCALGILEAPKTWHVLEFKTHNNKSFKALVKKGVQIHKPMHYDQMQIYMLKTGMTRALYLACNKDTDDLHAERVKLNKEYAEKLMQKAERIITATRPPTRGFDADDWQCKYCAFAGLCHGDPEGMAVPCEVNCRTCMFAGPVMDSGKWACALKDKELSKNDQLKGCDKHLFAPEIITFAELVDVTEKGALYRNENGFEWQNGRGKKRFTSEELTRLPYSVMVGDEIKGVLNLKERFCGEVK